jgi:hypothetical protein
MNSKTKLVLAAIALVIAARAYGSYVPGLDAIAAKLPGAK